jgi:hypothetical protein
MSSTGVWGTLLGLVLLPPKTGGVDQVAAAEAFKRFIEQPPAHVSASLIVEAAGFSTNSHYVKWQTNALFLGSLYNYAGPLGPETALEAYHTIVARYDNVYWFKNQNSFYCWTNRQVKAELDNSLLYTYQRNYETTVTDLLHLGCSLVPHGSIKWVGNEFQATNHSGSLLVRGRLNLSEGEGPLRMSCDLLPLPSSKEHRPAEWTFQYFYQNPQFPLLPTTVEQVSSSGVRSFVRIQWLCILDYTLTKHEFALSTQDFSGLVAYTTISNQFLVITTTNGTRLERDRPLVAASADTRLRPIAILLLALFALAPAVGFGWRQCRKLRSQSITTSSN